MSRRSHRERARGYIPPGWDSDVPPGQRHVAVDVVCRRCAEAGRDRLLARFGRYCYPGADPEPWEQAVRIGGVLTRSRWSGPDGDDIVHLGCECGHVADRPRRWIHEQLDTVPRDEYGRGVVRVRV